jgi:hypothetical protein
VFSIISNEENLKQNDAFFTLIEMVRFAWKREEQILIFKEKQK